MPRVKRLKPQADIGRDERDLALSPGLHRQPLDLFRPRPSTAINEQINADLIDGPLAHMPSGIFTASAAWLTLAVITFNLLCALGCLASAFHAKARGTHCTVS